MEILRFIARNADAVALVIIGGLLLASAVKRTAEHERAVIVRLGKFHRVAGPGTVLIIPYVDRVLTVNLEEKVPHWRAMSREEIVRELERRVLKAREERGRR